MLTGTAPTPDRRTTMRCATPPLHALPLAMAAMLLSAGALAQGRPQQQQQGGSMPTRSQQGDETRKRSAEDGLPADPWRAWRQSLAEARGALALNPAQQQAFDDFLRELDDVQRLNTARLLRMAHGVRPVVSAQPDVERDLRNEQADARNWADALGDLAQRWQALTEQLTPAQRERVLLAYAQSRQRALAGQGEPGAPGGGSGGRPPGGGMGPPG